MSPMKNQKHQFYNFYMKFSISKHHRRRNFLAFKLREGEKEVGNLQLILTTLFVESEFRGFFRVCFQSIVRKISKNSNFLSPSPQPEIDKISSCMAFTDTKLHPKIIKLLFWNFHWGHYVSVSHLDSVKVPFFSVGGHWL